MSAPIDVAAIPLALYVHVPWCVRKCPYCDFNSHRAPRALPIAEYVDALLDDLAVEAPFAAERPLRSVFFGGGTPSLFPPEAIARVLDAARAQLGFTNDVEITLEANPGTIEHGDFEGYARAGVNRVSFGVQSFDDAILARIGRIHSADEARHAVKRARAAGLGNINVDLMYALPGQTLAGAIADVDAALALEPAHVSHYQLTLEPGTPFARQPPPLPDDEAAWAMFEACAARLCEAGFEHYETSAYARTNRRSAHNQVYWSFGDYLGIGAGAHAKTSTPAGVERRARVRAPGRYLATRGHARLESRGEVAREQLPFEFMLNALRLHEGFDWHTFEARTGLPRASVAAALARCVDRGWLTDDGTRVVPTALGRRFLNDVLGEFLP